MFSFKKLNVPPLSLLNASVNIFLGLVHPLRKIFAPIINKSQLTFAFHIVKIYKLAYFSHAEQASAAYKLMIICFLTWYTFMRNANSRRHERRFNNLTTNG